MDSRRRIISKLVWLVPLLASIAGGVNGQTPTPSIELTLSALSRIAEDFDAGRSPLYCYFGTVARPSMPAIHVDSVTIISTPADCRGVGVAFLSRIADPGFLLPSLRGLIEANPGLVVVSAFYCTEDYRNATALTRIGRALSVMRPAPQSMVRGSS